MVIRVGKWQLTAEPFGGLLLNRVTFDEYELGGMEYLYARLLLSGYSPNHIAQALDSLAESPYFAPEGLTQLFQNAEVAPRIYGIEKSVRDGVEELESAQILNHLSAPTEVTIYPTMKCQLSCSFCFVKERLSKKDTDLPAEVWIELCKNLVDKGVRSISVLGGEPLLYRNISELLDGLNSLNIRVTFTSNGQHVKPEFIDELATWPNVRAIFSLHTLSRRSKLVMGAHYDPRRTVESMRKVRERGLPCRMNTVLTDQTMEELIELEAITRSLSLEKWSIAYPYSVEPLLSVSKFLQITDSLVSLSRKNHSSTYVSPEGCMIFAVDDIGHANLGAFSEYQELTYGCEAGQSILEIGPQGQMYPCAAMMNDDQVIGNAFTGDWHTVWQDSPVLSALRNIETPSICISCALSDFCKGGCPALRKSVGMDFSQRDPRCEVTI